MRDIEWRTHNSEVDLTGVEVRHSRRTAKPILQLAFGRKTNLNKWLPSKIRLFIPFGNKLYVLTALPRWSQLQFARHWYIFRDPLIWFDEVWKLLIQLSCFWLIPSAYKVRSPQYSPCRISWNQTSGHLGKQCFRETWESSLFVCSKPICNAYLLPYTRFQHGLSKRTTFCTPSLAPIQANENIQV